MSSFLASHSEESVAALIDSVTDSINTPVLATEDKEEQFQQTLIPPQEEVHSKCEDHIAEQVQLTSDSGADGHPCSLVTEPMQINKNNICPFVSFQEISTAPGGFVAESQKYKRRKTKIPQIVQPILMVDCTSSACSSKLESTVALKVTAEPTRRSLIAQARPRCRGRFVTTAEFTDFVSVTDLE
mmetsp:Transcript_21695/g.31481  ORF Transcript_21695/g.31481 Transcript_21695/m.31481 type:complete len:185 (-) Transcript_21695:16-570(-)